MRNAAVYILIRFVSQGAVFLATLIIARELPIEAFAAIGAALLLQTLLVTLSGLSLHNALERYYFTYGDDQRSGKVFSIWVASMAVNVTFSLLALGAIDVFQMNFLTQWQVVSILLATVLQSAQYVPSVVMRCREEMKVFAAMQLAFIVLTQATVVVWVLFDKSVNGWFNGTLVGSIAAFVMWAGWILLATKGRRLVSIRDEVKYVLPVIPISILEALQATSDRAILQATVPAAQFAAYSLGQRFASPIATFTSGAKSAIYPILYRTKTPEEASKMLAAATNASIAALGALTCLSSVAIAVVIQYFLASDYASVFPIFLAIAGGLFIRGQEVLLGVGPDITLQQGHKLRSLGPVLLLQIALATALTFYFGLWGAAAAFLLNSVIRTGNMAALGQRLLPRDINQAEYWVATVIPLVTLVAFGMGAMDGTPAGPELLAAVAPMIVLIYLLRKGA